MERFQQRISSVLVLLLFILLAIIALFPFYTLLLASLKPSTEMLRNGLNLSIQPEILSLKNYIHLFTEDGLIYFTWYKNSILITFLHTLLSIGLASFVGYGLAVYQFKGRNLIFALVMFVLVVPFEIIMLPLYRLSIALGIMNTVAGVILPFVVGPVVIFFFRQYALGLPKELMDAGRIDGCNEFGIFFRIMAPLMAPAYGAMAILQAFFQWNNFLWPLIVLRTSEKFTLPIGLSTLLTPYGNNYDVLLSGSVMSIIPIVILYLFFQRYFVSGLTVGGVKG